MKRKTHLITGIITSMIFIMLYNISVFSYQCNNICDNTIRLHIIASSDNITDQTVKLKIRDELLRKTPEIFDGSITTENAAEKLLPELSNIQNIADEVLKKNNISYRSEVSLETEYFDTRIYENGLIMPAGKYLALKINLGNCSGQNWWCIMFPALCLPTINAQTEKVVENVYSEKEKNIIYSSGKYEIRFKIIEYIELLKHKVDIA